MKVIIISDIHDNLINLGKALKWAGVNEVDELICCGDVSNSETLGYLSKNFKGPIHLVSSNVELFAKNELADYDNISYYGKTGRFKLDGYSVGLCHEPFRIKEIIKKNPVNIVFYGHTHQPWQEKRSTYLEVNPGNLSGVRERASFAVWDTKNKSLELKILDELS